MAQVRNTQVVLRDFVSGYPKESDMRVAESTVTLKVPEGSEEVLLKNLYLSCDPGMRVQMSQVQSPGGFSPFTPGSVSHPSPMIKSFYFFCLVVLLVFSD